uniref:Uncharacterized protein n=1 Tax=Anopheles melas TaxID=34690 RepID=A0A182TZW7_9DIPT
MYISTGTSCRKAQDGILDYYCGGHEQSYQQVGALYCSHKPAHRIQQPTEQPVPRTTTTTAGRLFCGRAEVHLPQFVPQMRILAGEHVKVVGEPFARPKPAGGSIGERGVREPVQRGAHVPRRFRWDVPAVEQIEHRLLMVEQPLHQRNLKSNRGKCSQPYDSEAPRSTVHGLYWKPYSCQVPFRSSPYSRMISRRIERILESSFRNCLTSSTNTSSGAARTIVCITFKYWSWVKVGWKPRTDDHEQADRFHKPATVTVGRIVCAVACCCPPTASTSARVVHRQPVLHPHDQLVLVVQQCDQQRQHQRRQKAIVAAPDNVQKDVPPDGEPAHGPARCEEQPRHDQLAQVHVDRAEPVERVRQLVRVPAVRRRQRHRFVVALQPVQRPPEGAAARQLHRAGREHEPKHEPLEQQQRNRLHRMPPVGEAGRREQYAQEARLEQQMVGLLAEGLRYLDEREPAVGARDEPQERDGSADQTQQIDCLVTVAQPDEGRELEQAEPLLQRAVRQYAARRQNAPIAVQSCGEGGDVNPREKAKSGPTGFGGSGSEINRSALMDSDMSRSPSPMFRNEKASER